MGISLWSKGKMLFQFDAWKKPEYVKKYSFKILLFMSLNYVALHLIIWNNQHGISVLIKNPLSFRRFGVINFQKSIIVEKRKIKIETIAPKVR